MQWIVTDNVAVETWRRLLVFANVDIAEEELVRRHGPASKSSASAYKKQARQIRVALLQAREYFDAATASSLFTSPNHLYYGVTALSVATMLVLGDGSRSLDYLRKDPKNSHHGLKFTTGCSASNASNGLSLVEGSRVEILRDGHFSNWHSVLPSQVRDYAYFIEAVDGGERTARSAFGMQRTLKTTELLGRKYALLDLLRQLPDLSSDLPHYGVEMACSRITQKVTTRKDLTRVFTWLVHGANSLHARDALLERFRISSSYADCLVGHFAEKSIGGVVKLTVGAGQSPPYLEWPSTRETLSHDSVAYAADFDSMEAVDGFLVCYQLSMLSRYFPDLWVACLESHCKGAKLIERAVDILVKKMPLLMLSMLLENGIVISTHREPWKSL
jgi:hypothetical protein